MTLIASWMCSLTAVEEDLSINRRSKTGMIVCKVVLSTALGAALILVLIRRHDTTHIDSRFRTVMIGSKSLVKPRRERIFLRAPARESKEKTWVDNVAVIPISRLLFH